MKHPLLLSAAILFNAATLQAAVTLNETAGWFESGYVTWTPLSTATSYNVYVRAGEGAYARLDNELVRDYGSYGRADAVGLAAGEYQFKVVPVDAEGNEMSSEATESAPFTATAYDRGGFAHFKTSSSTFKPADGIGAYKNDGTLKDNAKVIYVHANNAKTIKTRVITSSSGSTTEYTGLQNIIDGYQKGYDKTPIDFRIIGTIKAADMDKFSSSAEGLQIKGKADYSELNITIEGIGNDATIHGFGFLIRNACSVELRNFGIMWCMDDAVSMDTKNCNLWIHNLDLFYGQRGSAADQKKGDGTLDIKEDSRYSTLSYNHLWDNGKSSLCGMKSETGPNYLTYHHNWFDHSDSRHPRIRTMSVHVYNNYYDGNSKYGIGATTGADVFAEANNFRNCKYPMLSSKQGSDVHNGVGTSDETKGTFSGEAGGSIKAYGNVMTGQRSFEAWNETTYKTHFDAYVVSSRDQQVPETVTALLGGDTYSNFDTDPELMYYGYHVDDANDVPQIVTGRLGAGRCQHGDFTWTFGANEDNNAEVIPALSTAIENYQSTLVGFYGQPISNGGGSDEEHNGGSDEGGSGDNTGEDSGDDNQEEQQDATLLYQYRITGMVDAVVKDGSTMNYSDTLTAIGGRCILGNVAKIEASEYSSTGFATKLDGDASATSTKNVQVLLNQPLKAGDVITLDCYCTSNPSASNVYGVSIYSDPAASALASVNNTVKNKEEHLSLTVGDELSGLDHFYLFRNPAKSVYFIGISVNGTSDSAIESVHTSRTTTQTIDLLGRPVTGVRPGQLIIEEGRKKIQR